MFLLAYSHPLDSPFCATTFPLLSLYFQFHHSKFLSSDSPSNSSYLISLVHPIPFTKSVPLSLFIPLLLCLSLSFFISQSPLEILPLFLPIWNSLPLDCSSLPQFHSSFSCLLLHSLSLPDCCFLSLDTRKNTIIDCENLCIKQIYIQIFKI